MFLFHRKKEKTPDPLPVSNEKEADKKPSQPGDKAFTDETTEINSLSKTETVGSFSEKDLKKAEAAKKKGNPQPTGKKVRSPTTVVKTLPDDLRRFQPDLKDGLADADVQLRNDQGLTNKSKVSGTKPIWRIFTDNIFTFFNMLLLGIAITLMIFGLFTSTYFLWVAVVNTVICIVQEIRAKKTIDRLKLVTAQNVLVVRNGKQVKLPTDCLVLDDIYLLKNGDQIPTDSIIKDGDIEVNESLLTGESHPIKKNVGDRILAGSFVVSGSATVQADKIGDYNYASGIQSKAKEYSKPKSELLRSLNMIIFVISLIIIPLAGFLFWTQWNVQWQLVADGSRKIWTVAQKAVSATAGSAVGMIPSGMYLLTSVALAVGVMSLSKKNTLVQDIYCIEMLARVNVLCLDKTGTLTDGTMKVDEVLMIDNSYDFTKVMGSYLSSFNESNQTSIALSQRYPLRSDYTPIAKIPFSSARKYSAVTFADDMGTFILGAPEFIYKNKDRIILNYISEKQAAGFRIVMLCHSDSPIKNGEITGKVTPIAIFTLEDHIRPQAPNTIKWFVENGVRIKIISGDNPLTASEIAKKCGVPDAEKCVSLEGLSPQEVSEIVDQYTVFGRVSPEQKAAIVEKLKSEKDTVGMTGDGVNDILAMKKADCSIAMANGASAARNVAHLVLLDSNFASMPAVVQEGRRVINNIQRSSSLFLMKTIFTITFTLVVLLSFLNGGHGIEYPFTTNNIMIMEVVGIGVPSFFLALQKNDSLITGHFLKNTFSRAIPGAICLVLAIGINYILRASDNFLDLTCISGTSTFDQSSSLAFTTMCSLTMAIISMAMVYNCCTPFNTYRLILFTSLLALFVFMVFALPYLPALGSRPERFPATDENGNAIYWNLSMELSGIDFHFMNKTMWLVLVIYGTVEVAFLNLLIKAFAKMREGPVFGPLIKKSEEKMDKKESGDDKSKQA
jgi:cation-transporting ATPase E